MFPHWAQPGAGLMILQSTAEHCGFPHPQTHWTTHPLPPETDSSAQAAGCSAWCLGCPSRPITPTASLSSPFGSNQQTQPWPGCRQQQPTHSHTTLHGLQHLLDSSSSRDVHVVRHASLDCAPPRVLHQTRQHTHHCGTGTPAASKSFSPTMTPPSAPICTTPSTCASPCRHTAGGY